MVRNKILAIFFTNVSILVTSLQRLPFRMVGLGMGETQWFEFNIT